MDQRSHIELQTKRHTYVDLHFSVQAIVDDQVVRHANSKRRGKIFGWIRGETAIEQHGNRDLPVRLPRRTDDGAKKMNMKEVS